MLGGVGGRPGNRAPIPIALFVDIVVCRDSKVIRDPGTGMVLSIVGRSNPIRSK